MAPKGPPNLAPNAACLAIAQQNQGQSCLLRLPAELRTYIYDLTLDTDSEKILHDDHPTWDRLNLSRACRQIFAETAKSYFKSKILPLSNRSGICFAGADDMARIIQALTPSQKNCVITIIFEWWQASPMAGFDEKKNWRDLPNLKFCGFRNMALGCEPSVIIQRLVEERLGRLTNARVKLYEKDHEALMLG